MIYNPKKFLLMFLLMLLLDAMVDIPEKFLPRLSVDVICCYCYDWRILVVRCGLFLLMLLLDAMIDIPEKFLLCVSVNDETATIGGNWFVSSNSFSKVHSRL